MAPPKTQKTPAKKGQKHSEPDQPVVTLEEALSLAQGHHRTGNHLLAERTYRDILRAVPDHFPTTHYLGILLFQAGNLDQAKHYLQSAVAADPTDKGAWNNFGGVLTQSGDYEAAIEAYDKALAVDPDFLDSLNNKSYSLWQLGRLKEAEATARHALKLAPDQMVALNNMGIILSKRVKYEESLDIWQKASDLNPNEAMIWSNWSNSLREMGRLAEAEEKGRKAVELGPKNAEALSNLGNALRDQGKLEEAIALYRRATNEKPDYYQAHVNLAIALTDDGLYEEAAIAGRYAIAFKNDLPEGYGILSKIYAELGQFDQAHRAAQRSVHLNPDHIIPYLDLAEILTRLEQLDDAQAAMQEALKREPDSPRAYLKLAEIFDSMNNYPAAYEAIDTAIKMSPEMPKLWLNKGLIYYGEGQVAKAVEMMDKTLELSPGWPIALQHKAEMQISLNQSAEAEANLRKIIAAHPHLPTPYVPLASLKKFKSEDDPDFQRMLGLLDKLEAYGPHMMTGFYFAMAEAYEQMKKYPEAFDYLKRANDLRRKTIPFVMWKDTDFHKLTKEQYTPAHLAKHLGTGSKSELPVFILGMPRSGTTLTESILSSHPKVFGAGELSDIGQVHKMTVSGEMIDAVEVGEEYIRRLKAKDPTGKAERITDKMPANYMYIGFIKTILPNAKIIHCRRNPIDTALSCYKQNFARGQHWSYDLEELGDAYLRYEDLMQYWREVMPPGSFIEIDYEETVNNLEATARRLIDFVGLEWDDACLEPHKQDRPILTASKGQVTQPVYKTSVDKWKIYEEQLQPLVRKLMPEKALKK